MSALKKDFEPVFQVFLDLLMHPEFRQDKIDLAKEQLRTMISRRNDQPPQIASREARKIAWGPGNPYGFQAEYWTVAAVTRQDLLGWHQRTVHPNNIILGVVGDFDPVAMEARLRKAFENWPKGPASPQVEITFQQPKAGVYVVPKEDVTQSEIRMVYLGIQKKNPDYYAVEVMNQMYLSGGFSAKLLNEVRTRLGLAYAVGGALGSDYDHPGLFYLSAGTKTPSTVEAIQAIERVLKEMQTPPATPQAKKELLGEMQRAKDALLNSFVFEFDSKSKVMNERMRLEFYNYPADWLERYRAGIEKVTLDDVEQVIHKYIDPSKIATVVVGKEKDFQPPLSTVGTPTLLDVTIRTQPAGSEAAKPVASNPEGKALMAKVVQAMGGTEKVMAVKALREKSTTTRQTPMGEMQLQTESWIVLPDQVHLDLTSPMGAMMLVVSPSASFVARGGMSQDLPASQSKELLKEIHRSTLSVAQHSNDPDYVFSAQGSEEVDGTPAEILDVHAPELDVRWWIDSNGKVIQTKYTGGQPPSEHLRKNSDFRTVDGITIPFQETSFQGDKQVASATVTEFEVNPQVDPSLFQKPGGGQPPEQK